MSVSFVVWALVMVVIVCGMAMAGRKTRRIERRMEQIASEALPAIGAVAERRHTQTFGRAASAVPTSGTWYPAPGGAAAAKKKSKSA